MTDALLAVNGLTKYFPVIKGVVRAREWLALQTCSETLSVFIIRPTAQWYGVLVIISLPPVGNGPAGAFEQKYTVSI
jgi:hypothetical protein